MLDKPALREWKNGKVTKAPYPFCFDPTFHRYKLDEPQHWKKPRTIFVCSMADLFGDWVPDEWIEQVFKACEAAPQHRYMFLTKNPARFKQLRKNGIKLPNYCWIGTSVTRDAEQADQYTGRTGYLSENWDTTAQWFVSVEPILERMSRSSIENLTAMNWVIVGAETGNRKGKVVPRKEWIDEIAAECKRCRTPIFMKDSLRGLMGADFKQEFPWEEGWKQIFPDALYTPCPGNYGKKYKNTSCASVSCERCRERPIPAEIAKKLGIKPVVKEWEQ